MSATEHRARHTGGCLCGAIRYRLAGDHSHAVHCHCAMCRKATGALFATWVCFPRDAFEQLAGDPALRRSSGNVERAFCPDCGSPLFMRYDGSSTIDIALGSLDAPELIRVDRNIWTCERIPSAKGFDADLTDYPRFRPSEE